MVDELTMSLVQYKSRECKCDFCQKWTTSDKVIHWGSRTDVLYSKATGERAELRNPLFMCEECKRDIQA